GRFHRMAIPPSVVHGLSSTTRWSSATSTTTHRSTTASATTASTPSATSTAWTTAAHGVALLCLRLGRVIHQQRFQWQRIGQNNVANVVASNRERVQRLLCARLGDQLHRL